MLFGYLHVNRQFELQVSELLIGLTAARCLIIVQSLQGQHLLVSDL